MDTLHILYVSSLCSERMFEKLFSSSRNRHSTASQKFHRLIVDGMIANEQRVQVLSVLPVSRTSHSKIVWEGLTESFGKLKFHYLFFVNIPLLRHVFVFIGAFFSTFAWGLKNRKAQKVVYCDVLNITITLAARIAAKLTGIQAIGIVTDLQKNIGAARMDNRHTKIVPRLISKFSNLFITSFDKYVILTAAMNEEVNPKGKPFIVMEGLVDVNMKTKAHESFATASKDIIYAGGIYEKYGVRMLIDAFYNVQQSNVNLHIYGPGEMKKDMEYLMNRDPRLIYHGMVSNEVVVKHQLTAALMVNPRPTYNGFTKFSFPSKNLEYMASGTPLLTTPLEGMPDEYKQYVYLINDETIEGLKQCITEIINKPAFELEAKGSEAKQFVLDKKNNVVQSQRMISLAKLKK